MTSISCENVSICYLIGDLKSVGLKEYCMRRIKGNYQVKKFWADKNITFSLEKGDLLGIIGSNGAGKSTLLKAVSGILRPSEGTMAIKGKIAALLELTSGFDRDLTVRENTYLRGALMGYTRKFMDEKYQEIIDFAELQDYQEYYFKQLSSGMKSRLAFSIACLVQPDILILDEVLSVGDTAFRKKSGDRMKEILNSGVTGILVSHSIGQIKQLCNKVLWLDHGNQVVFSDEVSLYCNAYQEYQETKYLPANRDEAQEMADSYIIRMREARAERAKKQLEKLGETLAESPTDCIAVDELVGEAERILRAYRPELLSHTSEESKEGILLEDPFIDDET